MATVAVSGTPSLATPVPCPAHRVGSGFLAGEAITAGQPCYIKASDGKVYVSTGAAANAAAKVDGFAAQATAAGEAVTLLTDVDFRYGAGMTPGTRLYLGATAGILADAASTGGTGVVGIVLDATRIRVWSGRY